MPPAAPTQPTAAPAVQVLGLMARMLSVLPGMPLPAARVRYELGAGVWLLEGLALPAVSLVSGEQGARWGAWLRCS